MKIILNKESVKFNLHFFIRYIYFEVLFLRIKFFSLNIFYFLY